MSDAAMRSSDDDVVVSCNRSYGPHYFRPNMPTERCSTRLRAASRRANASVSAVDTAMALAAAAGSSALRFIAVGCGADGADVRGGGQGHGRRRRALASGTFPHFAVTDMALPPAAEATRCAVAAVFALEAS